MNRWRHCRIRPIHHRLQDGAITSCTRQTDALPCDRAGARFLVNLLRRRSLASWRVEDGIGDVVANTAPGALLLSVSARMLLSCSRSAPARSRHRPPVVDRRGGRLRLQA